MSKIKEKALVNAKKWRGVKIYWNFREINFKISIFSAWAGYNLDLSLIHI